MRGNPLRVSERRTQVTGINSLKDDVHAWAAATAKHSALMEKAKEQRMKLYPELCVVWCCEGERYRRGLCKKHVLKLRAAKQEELRMERWRAGAAQRSAASHLRKRLYFNYGLTKDSPPALVAAFTELLRVRRLLKGIDK